MILHFKSITNGRFRLSVFVCRKTNNVIDIFIKSDIINVLNLNF